MGAQHKQQAGEKTTTIQSSALSERGKTLFLTIFDQATYVGLFKAGTACFVVWLIGTSQPH